MSDRMKLAFEFFKHLSTLNTACIVLMAGLVERVFTKPTDTNEVITMFMLFGASLIASLLVMLCLVGAPEKLDRERKWHEWWFTLLLLTLMIAIIFFIGGLKGAVDVMQHQQNVFGHRGESTDNAYPPAPTFPVDPQPNRGPLRPR